MNIFFDNLFGKKSKTKGEVEIVTSSENKDIDTQSGKAEKWSVAYIEDLTSPIVAGSNYLRYSVRYLKSFSRSIILHRELQVLIFN